MSHTPSFPTSPSLHAHLPTVSCAADPVQWADPQRAQAFQQWLNAIATAQQLQPASLRIASADASFRRYLRIDTLPNNSASHTAPAMARIIMDAPPDKENSAPFVKIAQLLADAGLLAPQVLAWDEAQGFMLLTDLGAQTMMEQIDREHPEANLPRYMQAVDALLQWQTASKPGVLPPYDAALLNRELSLFPDWYIAKHRKFELNPKQRETMDSAFALIVQRNLAAPCVYVHRDFMPRNLMASEPDRLGVLDFQDAVYGPISYDIASLMRDAFLTWDEEFVLDVTIRYWEKARKLGLMDFDGWADDFGAFYRAVEWMGLQRHLKVAGIFARLTLRDGKPKYLADAPRFIHYIRTTCSRYRELGPLLKVIDEVEGTENTTAWSFGRM
jgi:N-acetylmuramate 1-kinase